MTNDLLFHHDVFGLRECTLLFISASVIGIIFIFTSTPDFSTVLRQVTQHGDNELFETGQLWCHNSTKNCIYRFFDWFNIGAQTAIHTRLSVGIKMYHISLHPRRIQTTTIFQHSVSCKICNSILIRNNLLLVVPQYDATHLGHWLTAPLPLLPNTMGITNDRRVITILVMLKKFF